MPSAHAGRFVYRELLTSEPARAAAFYNALFGWTVKESQMGMPQPYRLFQHPTLDEHVGGCMVPPMEGVPSHWLDYITVDDVDAALAQVSALGGQGITPAMDIPDVGRFAIVRDPIGAVFALFRGAKPGETDTERRAPDGTFCWSQLMARDPVAAIPFYEAIFGWKAEPMGEGMWVLKSGETTRASIMRMPAEAPMPSHWLQYVAVPDTDAAWDTAKRHGANSFMGPTTMEGMGRFAVLADPTGAVFALWKDLSRS